MLCERVFSSAYLPLQLLNQFMDFHQVSRQYNGNAGLHTALIEID